MSKQAELLAIAKRRLYANYKPASIVFTRGSGCELFDADGRRWLDLCAGVAVCSVGHAHPVLAKAIAEQASTLVHVSNYFYNEANIRLADELCTRTGMDRAFFCNSGAEANEALLKLAQHHFYGLGQKTRSRIVAFENAFHGRTLGALAMTGTPKYREGFGPLANVTHVPYGNLDLTRNALGPDVAAIVVEPVQGEGGVNVAPSGFLRGLRALADAAGALLFIDEVQTGIGRLGRFVASEGTSARPDGMAFAKGLAGGVPIGAVVTTEALAGALPPGTHGLTFGGNPLACTAALAVLKILDDEGLLAQVRTKGEFLGQALAKIAKDFPGVCEGARGEGLLQGLVLRPGYVARDVLPRLQAKGVLLTASGERVLRFSPPLVVSTAQLEEGVRAVREVVTELSSTTLQSVGV